MAANIEIRTIGGERKESFVSTEPAWHGLGKIYDTPLTAAEALKECGANFEVGLQNLIAATPQLETLLDGGMSINSDDTQIIEGKQFVSVDMLRKLVVPDYRATMRLDFNEPLGVVSNQYGIVQNAKAFEFVDLLTTGQLGGDAPTIECAGVLGHGERVFITAKFPEPIRIGKKDDIIDQYVVFTTSHDGSGAVTCMICNTRVVCQNTLNFALEHNSGKLSLRHTSRVNDRLDLTNKENADMAYRVLHLHNTYKAYFEESLSRLSKIKVTDKEAEKIMAQALFSPDTWKIYSSNGYSLNTDDISTRSKNMINSVTNAMHLGIGQDMLEKGTGLWVVNGLTTFYQNNTEWKNNERKFNAIVDGSVQQKLQKTVDLLLKSA